MSVLPNYLALQSGTEYPGPTVISAFRRYFHGSIDLGGTEQEFGIQWDNFKYDLINATLRSAQNREVGPLDEALHESIIRNIGTQIDNLYTLMLGMGQLASAWQLIPAPVEISLEDTPEIGSVASSSKSKPREARRFTHVLSNIIAKNFRVEGPHGVPEEARANVPDEDGMIVEMVMAMADKSEVLDFADTKPYKDHWQNMREPDFRRLAKTLIYHINELHQGIDYVEGFRYTDRYRNLISLLRTCKGTIYFMSRPSTYEDVILNPHMMKLRFADNQKNNAKKKVDNRELTARRNSEYINLHGCPPPPKVRTGGSGKKRSSSVTGENESETASSPPVRPAAKRQRGTPRNGKATGGVVFDAGESSSTQQTITVASPSLLSGLDQDRLDHEFYQLHDQGHGFDTPDQQQQPYYLAQQSFVPQQNSQYYNPPQHQQGPALQQLKHSAPKKPGSRKQQKNDLKGVRTQTAVLGLNPDPVIPTGSFMDLSSDIENQIATTLANAVRGNNYAVNPARTLASASTNEISSTNHQMYQQTGLYQTQNIIYPDISAHRTNEPVPVHDQIQLLEGQFKESGLESGTSAWYDQQQFHQASGASEFFDQGFRDQYPPLDLSNDTELGDPYWGGEAIPDFNFTEGILTRLGGKVDAGHQEAVDPQIFDHELQENETTGANYFQGVDMNTPGFGDLDFEFDDFEPSLSSSYLYLPAPMDAAPVSNAGGQAARRAFGSRNKMREMEEMLAADP